MSDLTNAQYFAQRASEARQMSKLASDPRAAEAHAHMADQYEALAKDFNTRQPIYQAEFPMEDQVQARG